ncbi:hypothetical protein BT96DRAFT_1003418 [Gymnopus androsaceus JB14]|uniref:Uncharacterized protein n=1 Tax=Gymnopus androsaceus JB14 TaxID=1447944 RepID=A0A6A4GVZ7_9AGAR|nr:hypothetical protein BT96DRAFT_1003418 [Gymnopus androsaceus JB14]
MSPLLIIHLAFIHPSTTTNLSANLSNVQNSPRTFQSFALWGPTINFVIGDGLVLWRAWSIWDVRSKCKRFWLGSVTILLMVGNIGIHIADASIDNIGLVSLSSGAALLDWLSLVVSLIVNIFATFLIGLKAWHLSQEFKNIHHPTGYFQIKKILLILVESGLVFCLIQVLFAVFNGVDVGNENLLSATSLVYSMIIAVANGCAALYPVALIIIIHMEAFSPFISFLPSESAVGPEFTTVYNEIEMQDMTTTS